MRPPYGIPQSPYTIPGKPYVRPPAATTYRQPPGGTKPSPIHSGRQPTQPGSSTSTIVAGNPHQISVCQIKVRDPEIVFRAVGFYEYRHALKHLDIVIQKTTQAERTAIDEILKERLGYGVTMLIGVANGKRKSLRHVGLSWITALARVELGAMLASLTRIERPFDVFAPKQFDLPQFRALMSEGYAVHMNYLKSDPTLFPKPKALGPYVVLIQDQHLKLLQHWNRKMIDVMVGQPVHGKQLVAESNQIEQIRKKLSSDYPKRLVRKTGVKMTITEDESD